MKIKPKLILISLLIALATAAGIGTLSYTSARKAINQQAVEDLVLVSEVAEGSLYAFLRGIEGRAIDFASDGFIRDSVEALAGLAPNDPRFASRQKTLNDHLKRNKQPLDKTIGLVMVIDPDGKVLAATDEDEIGRDESGDDYFVMRRAGPFVSGADVRYHAGGSRLRLAVSAPLHGRTSGGLLGVIVNFYDTRELDRLLSGKAQIEMGAMSGTLGRRETLDIYIVNRDGLLMTPSRAGGEVMKQRVDTPPVRECAAGREMAGTYGNHAGRDVIGASMCIPRMRWTLLAEIGTDEAFAPVRKLRADIVAVSAGVLAGVFLLAYIIALGIARPVAALSLAVGRVAEGDLEVRAPVQSRDEIGELAASFNTMTQRLVESYSRLINSEARLAHAQEVARVGDFEWDVKKNVLSWSDETYRIFGLGLGEFAPSFDGFLEFVHPDDGARVRFAVNQALAGREPYRIDFRIVRRDGSVRAVHAQGEVAIDEDGKPTRMFGTIQDVTEFKELEAQLRQSQKMEAVGRLAGGVAHDFNNMLTVITGYSEFLLRRLKENDPIRSELEAIRQAGERAAGLTRQLLAFSRRQVLAPQVLNLNKVVPEMEKMLGRLIGEDVELVTVLGSGLSNVKADPGQIEQVVMNLAVNARDAMPDGGKLTIETADADLSEAYAREHVGVAAGPYVMLAVSDTGVGMDEDTRSHIFEPFFTTKDVGKGTGLGLSTVYGIVRQSGGHIFVYSEPGKGTSFKIYFPRAEEEAAAPGKEGVPSEELRGTETILLVEDEKGVREFSGRVLRENGYTVFEAESGQAALDVLGRHEGPVDLLLTDVVMPGMGGFDLARRASVLRPGSGVLYMSGYTEEMIDERGLLEMDIPFLPKPFTPEALLRKVREVLASRKTRDRERV